MMRSVNDMRSHTMYHTGTPAERRSSTSIVRAPTSAEIIREARQSLALRNQPINRFAAQTKRPATPSARSRRLSALKRDSGSASSSSSSTLSYRSGSDHSFSGYNSSLETLSEEETSTRRNELALSPIPEPSVGNIDKIAPKCCIISMITAPVELKLHRESQKNAKIKLEPIKDNFPAEMQPMPGGRALAMRQRDQMCNNSKDEDTSNTGRAEGIVDDQLDDHRSSDSPTVESGYNSRQDSAISSDLNSSELQSVLNPKMPANATLIMTPLEDLVTDRLAALQSDVSEQELIAIATDLRQIVISNPVLCEGSKLRSIILKSVFRVLSEKQAELSLKLICVCFLLNVTGGNLKNVCRFIYRLSKDVNNDIYFENKVLLGMWLHVIENTDVSSADSRECLLFSLGALKFISSNAAICSILTQKQCCSVVCSLINPLLRQQPDTSSTEDPSSMVLHCIIQTVAILRNLLDVGAQAREQVLADNRLVTILAALYKLKSERDLCLNCSRLLSKLSLYDDCCLVMLQISNIFDTTEYILRTFYRKQDVTIRILFVIGNLLNVTENAHAMCSQQERLTDTLLKMLIYYTHRDKQDLSDQGNAASSPASSTKGNCDDLLVKLIRVFANLTAAEEVALKLCGQPDLTNRLLMLINTRVDDGVEELVLNSLVTLNNLSFYMPSSKDNVHTWIEIANELQHLITSKLADVCLVEAMRVLSNLSRSEPIRKQLAVTKTHMSVVDLMKATQDSTLIVACCGLLINMTCIEDVAMDLLAQPERLDTLLTIFHSFGPPKWYVMSNILQLIGNALSHGTVLQKVQIRKLRSLAKTLLLYLDEHSAQLPPEAPDDLSRDLRELWEDEFCPVASNVLELISNKLDNG